MSKTNKVMTGIISTAFLLNLAACNKEAEEEYPKTSSSGNASTIPDPPMDSSCTDWEWDEYDQVWECDDSSSSHYGHYYYGGHYYNTRTALHKSSAFKAAKAKSTSGSSSTYSNKSTNSSTNSSANNSSINKGSSVGTGKENKSSAKRSSGFGSGSKSYGG